MIYHNYIFWDFYGRSYHCMAVWANWNLSKFTGSTGKSLYSNFLENRSVLGAKISSAFNTSTGASKYIKLVKNHQPLIFRNFPKLCNTFKLIQGHQDQPWMPFWLASMPLSLALEIFCALSNSSYLCCNIRMCPTEKWPCPKNIEI